MAYEDRERRYIDTLIDNQNWIAAYNALVAYIDANGKDLYWAKNQLILVKDKLK